MVLAAADVPKILVREIIPSRGISTNLAGCSPVSEKKRSHQSMIGTGKAANEPKIIRPIYKKIKFEPSKYLSTLFCPSPSILHDFAFLSCFFFQAETGVPANIIGKTIPLRIISNLGGPSTNEPMRLHQTGAPVYRFSNIIQSRGTSTNLAGSSLVIGEKRSHQTMIGNAKAADEPKTVLPIQQTTVSGILGPHKQPKSMQGDQDLS